jgi:hypothetical protein
MATVRVIDIIERAEDILLDDGVRWPRLELQNWINEAYTAIILSRPDASSTSATYTCSEGTRQNVSTAFPGALRLLDVIRNVSATSLKKVIRLAPRAQLDDQIPDWHNKPTSVDLQYYVYDPRQPLDFFVYPPATTTAQLEILYTQIPGTHALTESQLDPANSGTEVILLPDTYMTPIIDWVLYRAYSKDSEHPANEGRAGAYYQAFTTSLGTKTASDAAVMPRE